MFRWIDDKYAPVKKTVYSAGFDIKCRGNHIALAEDVTMIPTGVYLDLKSEAVSQMKENAFVGLFIRSSLAKQGLMLANGTGIIDLDYPDEICLLVYNPTQYDFPLRDGERIAQMIILPHLGFSQELIKATYEYNVRNGGFGSTN